MKNQLKIHGVAFEGRGVGRRKDGKVVFVEGAVPGDVVEDNPSVVKKKFDVIKEPVWLQKSELHIESPCKISYQCGGCQWQYISPRAQEDWKMQFLTDAFKRVGRLTHIPKIEFLPAQERFRYRPRLTIQGEPKNGILRWGFFKKASHNVIEARGCHVATPAISNLLIKLNELKIRVSHRAKLHIQEVKTLTEGTTKLNITVLPPSKPNLKNELIRNLKGKDINWIGDKSELGKAPLAIWWQDELTYLTSPYQFQQSHHTQNERLKKVILEEVEKVGPDSITDLFCGSGNLSLPLLKQGYPVEGIEVDETAIRVAKHNLEINNLIGSYLNDSATRRRALTRKPNKKHLVIVDPPRAGLQKGIDPLIQAEPDHIFYVSCHPMTLAGDVSRLIEHGYEIKKIMGMDFFPGTFHVESFVILEKTIKRADNEAKI